MSSRDIVKRPFITGFCRFGKHEDGTPHDTCPVVVKHDRTAKTWVCACKCHEGQDLSLLLEAPVLAAPKVSVPTDGEAPFTVNTQAWEAIWGVTVAQSRMQNALRAVILQRV